jgi:hypothetical protein
MIDSNRHSLTSLSQITVQFKVVSDQRPFQILRSMADLLVGLTVMAYVSDVIGRRFETLKPEAPRSL